MRSGETESTCSLCEVGARALLFRARLEELGQGFLTGGKIGLAVEEPVDPGMREPGAPRRGGAVGGDGVERGLGEQGARYLLVGLAPPGEEGGAHGVAFHRETQHVAAVQPSDGSGEDEREADEAGGYDPPEGGAKFGAPRCDGGERDQPDDQGRLGADDKLKRAQEPETAGYIERAGGHQGGEEMKGARRWRAASYGVAASDEVEASGEAGSRAGSRSTSRGSS